MSLLTDEEIKPLGEGTSGTWQDDLQFARAIEAAVIKKLREQEPVAIVGDVYQLMWFGSSPIAAITSKHGIKVGDKLYTHPVPQSEWQPIETAPKDGTRILVKGDCVVVAGWGRVHWVVGLIEHGWQVVNDAFMPEHIATHWMSLPKPPEAK